MDILNGVLFAFSLITICILFNVFAMLAVKTCEPISGAIYAITCFIVLVLFFNEIKYDMKERREVKVLKTIYPSALEECKTLLKEDWKQDICFKEKMKAN